MATFISPSANVILDAIENILYPLDEPRGHQWNGGDVCEALAALLSECRPEAHLRQPEEPPFNSYNVTFTFETTSITTTVFAMHEDVAPEVATDQIASDLNVHHMVLAAAQEVTVELIDKAVL